MPQIYSTDQTRTLDRFAEAAKTKSSLASDKWPGALAAAQAEESSKEEDFIALLTPEAASDLAKAKAKVRDLTDAVAAIERAGGGKQIRVRELRAPDVFGIFAQGFAEKIATLEKLIPKARKGLAQIRSTLTEEGVAFPHIEGDSVVRAWRSYGDSITVHLASATFGKTYSEKRGEGYERETFENLYGRLTQPLPEPPTT